MLGSISTIIKHRHDTCHGGKALHPEYCAVCQKVVSGEYIKEGVIEAIKVSAFIAFVILWSLGVYFIHY